MFESESGVGTKWSIVALIGLTLHLLCLHILIWKLPKMVPKLSSVSPKGCSRFPWMKLLVLFPMYAELFTKSLQILIRSLPVCGEATLQMEALFKRSVSYPVWGFHAAHGQTRCGKISAWFTLDWLEKVHVPVCLLVLWDAFSKCKHFGRVWVDRLFHKIELYQVQSYW